MPIPSSPITRTEQYLNAMATGDASGIPSAPITREEQYLDYIAQNGGGGSSDLPAVTAEDNGDVLTVVDGAWAKAAPSGGILLVTETLDDIIYTLNKTWQEILNAATDGFVVIKGIYSGGANLKYIDSIYSYPDGDDTVYCVDSGTVTYTTNSASGFPSYEYDPH